MQLAKTFGVSALHIVGSRASASRKLYSAVKVHQRVSLALLNPRGNNRNPLEENVYAQQMEEVAEKGTDVVNKVEKSSRGQTRNAETELEEIESNLFNNRQRKENLHLNDILRKYNNSSFESPDRRNDSKKQKKPTKSHRLGELDVDTLNTLKSYKNDEKSIEQYDETRKLKYLKLKRGDPLFGDLKLLVTSRKRRELKDKLVLEGRRLILDGLEAGLSPDIILFNELNSLNGIKIKSKSVKYIQLQSHLLQEWSDLVTCPGVIGIFNKPKKMTEMMIRNKTTQALPITVVCDNIREPNNLGSIIRSCAAIPVNSVVLLKGCTHPWDLKCLRGGAGAHFRTNIIGPLTMDELAEFVPPNASFLVADNRSEGTDEKFIFSRYDAANYCDMEHVVLVIGGETHGVSSDVRRFITDFSRNASAMNHNVHIPLENGVESLNTASAASVILCEIRRQLNSGML